MGLIPFLFPISALVGMITAVVLRTVYGRTRTIRGGRLDIELLGSFVALVVFVLANLVLGLVIVSGLEAIIDPVFLSFILIVAAVVPGWIAGRAWVEVLKRTGRPTTGPFEKG